MEDFEGWDVDEKGTEGDLFMAAEGFRIIPRTVDLLEGKGEGGKSELFDFRNRKKESFR